MVLTSPLFLSPRNTGVDAEAQGDDHVFTPAAWSQHSPEVCFLLVSLPKIPGIPGGVTWAPSVNISEASLFMFLQLFFIPPQSTSPNRGNTQTITQHYPGQSSGSCPGLAIISGDFRGGHIHLCAPAASSVKCWKNLFMRPLCRLNEITSAIYNAYQQ